MHLVVLSSRVVDTALHWRNLAPPLENALAAHDDATLVAAPPFRRPTIRPDQPAWLSAIRTLRKADAVFWIQLHLRPPAPVWALAYTKPRARRTAFVVDSYPHYHFKLILYAKAQRLAHCLIDYRSSVLALKATAPSQPFEWLPNAFEPSVFHDRGLERDIYALWVGRRYEPFHESLSRFCAREGLKYEFLEPPGRPISLDELSRLAARARYFVTLPPDLQDPIRTGGASPLTMRYLEGAGAGCRLLGLRPRSGEFELFLPPDAIVECSPDGSDLESKLVLADADPEFAAKAEASRDRAQSSHTWQIRAASIHARLRGAPEQPLDHV